MTKEDDSFEQKACLIFKDKFWKKFLNSIPDFLIIVNQKREVVYANKKFLNYLELENVEMVFGHRPGELIQCRNVHQTDHRCGTLKACVTCGAVQSVTLALEGKSTVKESRILKSNGEALDFKVASSPLVIGHEKYAIVVITDISHEKRRRALEHIFFHDLLNTASNIQGLIDSINIKKIDEILENKTILEKLSEELIEEIISQRDLLAAESNELYVNYTLFSIEELIQQVVFNFRNNSLANKRSIIIDKSSKDFTILSDKILMRRILVNMLKNALEASEISDIITVGYKNLDLEVEIWVHNPNYIPFEYQVQIFQRSFSTKNKARGLGTYSMKLLTEKYLHGKLNFISKRDQGTTFYAKYPKEH